MLMMFKYCCQCSWLLYSDLDYCSFFCHICGWYFSTSPPSNPLNGGLLVTPGARMMLAGRTTFCKYLDLLHYFGSYQWVTALEMVQHFQLEKTTKRKTNFWNHEIWKKRQSRRNSIDIILASIIYLLIQGNGSAGKQNLKNSIIFGCSALLYITICAISSNKRRYFAPACYLIWASSRTCKFLLNTVMLSTHCTIGWSIPCPTVSLLTHTLHQFD